MTKFSGYKGRNSKYEKSYITLEKSYIIHTFNKFSL